MCEEMRQVLDATGSLWTAGALAGKGGSVFASSNCQHGSRLPGENELAGARYQGRNAALVPREIVGARDAIMGELER